MNATLSRTGCLIVQAENPTEEFALSTWAESNRGAIDAGPNLFICHNHTISLDTLAEHMDAEERDVLNG